MKHIVNYDTFIPNYQYAHSTHIAEPEIGNMKHTSNAGCKSTLNRIATLVLSLSISVFSISTSAQSLKETHEQYPELANLFNAFDVIQAGIFDEIAAINADPATRMARNQLEIHLVEMANMSMSEMMAHGGHGGGMSMSMDMSKGPFHKLEVESRIKLLEKMRATNSDKDAKTAFKKSSAIDRHTATVLKQGRDFEQRLFAIYIDDSISDKQAAIASAIEDYLSDDRHSVATEPKNSAYLLSHDQATGFKSAFPLFSAFLWTQQWLQLAALEAVILQDLDYQATDGVSVTLERFWNKVGSSGGMSMFPAPNELPMAPAIAPDLYSQSPEAAVILDNLNILETVIVDILSFPNAENWEELIEQAVSLFTSKDSDSADTQGYLLFALRGGIYNQGGPAVGELMKSERNKGREQMNMKHSMIMATPH